VSLSPSQGLLSMSWPSISTNTSPASHTLTEIKRCHFRRSQRSLALTDTGLAAANNLLFGSCSRELCGAALASSRR
jgi:hypothetical protein